MHKALASTNILKIGNLKFYIDNGRLIIHAPGEQRPFSLTGQQTHALYNLLCDNRTDIVALSVVEERERERKNKERSVHKKPKMIQVNGQRVEAVEVAELEKEQNE